MNQIKPLTIDDVHQLKGEERKTVLRTWQRHNKKSWANAKREMRLLAGRIRAIKKRAERGDEIVSKDRFSE